MNIRHGTCCHNVIHYVKQKYVCHNLIHYVQIYMRVCVEIMSIKNLHYVFATKLEDIHFFDIGYGRGDTKYGAIIDMSISPFFRHMSIQLTIGNL